MKSVELFVGCSRNERMFKDRNKSVRATYEICLKFIVKAQEQHRRHHFVC